MVYCTRAHFVLQRHNLVQLAQSLLKEVYTKKSVQTVQYKERDIHCELGVATAV